MKVGRSLLAAFILLLCLLPAATLAGEYHPGEDATLYAQVLDSDGLPVNDATVVMTLWDTDGNKELDGVSMTYVTDSSGLYEYDYTVPSELGVYVAEVTSTNPTGYGSTEIHVVEQVSVNFTGNVTATIDPEAIWSEPVGNYTDDDTFGGMLAGIFGGMSMELNILGIICIAAMIAGFAFKNGLILLVTGIGWVAWGVMMFTEAPSTPAINNGILVLGLAFAIICFAFPLVTWMRSRSKLSPEDRDYEAHKRRVLDITHRDED